MGKKQKQAVDDVYAKYNGRVLKFLAKTDFYDYFSTLVESGKKQFQFSNRRVEKFVDESWVVAFENTIKALEEIVTNPRNFIVQEEVILNVALAKSVTPDTIKHLASHGKYVDEVTDDNVRPNHVMNKLKEETLDTYENRFAYTLLVKAFEFLDKRYEAIFSALQEEYGAYLITDSEINSYAEAIKVKIEMRIQQNEDLLAADEKHETIFSRIARLHRLMNAFLRSGFSLEVSKFGEVKPPIIRTNAIKKNPNFKACYNLWSFITNYDEVGYQINIYEQSSEIDEDFMKDIFHSVMFNYVILKHHIEDIRDREIEMGRKYKKKKRTPKFIKKIIEDIVKDYDLQDVEIRKVLIEELTKKDLMREEESERRRLVEEKEKEMQEKKRREKEEKKRLEKEKKRELARQKREAERAEARRLKKLQREEERLRKEQERLEQEEQSFEQKLIEELAKQKEEASKLFNKIKKQKELELRKKAAAEKAKREAEEKAKREAEEKAKREAAEKAKREAAEKAKREAAEKAKREAAEKAKREAAEKAKREAAEKAKREAEEKAKREAEEREAAEPEAAEAAEVENSSLASVIWRKIRRLAPWNEK